MLALEKTRLAELLEANADTARNFYKHMAISVTQRLSIVSAASAEIPEAPRGAAARALGSLSSEATQVRNLSCCPQWRMCEATRLGVRGRSQAWLARVQSK